MIGKALWVVCTKLKTLLASKLKLHKNMENIKLLPAISAKKRHGSCLTEF